VLNLVERFPAIIQIGAAVLAFTAAKMIVSEPLLAGLFGDTSAPQESAQTAARWVVYAAAIGGVLLAGKWAQSRGAATNS
jgi:predicted tellurium resistance membrane protein TerC